MQINDYKIQKYSKIIESNASIYQKIDFVNFSGNSFPQLG